MESRPIPFSERHGGAAPAPQLELGVLNDQARNLIWEKVVRSLKKCERSSSVGYARPWISDPWDKAMQLFWVRFLHQPIDEYDSNYDNNQKYLKKVVFEFDINSLFDSLEFLISLNHACFRELAEEINKALVEGRTAYRIVDGRYFTPLSSPPLLDAVNDGIEGSRNSGWINAETHLLEAAKDLRSGKWGKSVHQSISAVEGACRSITGARDLKGA